MNRGAPLERSAYPFFSVTAQLLVVNGADVQVFEYPTTAGAALAAFFFSGMMRKVIRL